MESRHSVGWPFVSEFSAICSRSEVIAGWSRKKLEVFDNFFGFFGKTTLYGEIFKILFRKDSCGHRLTCCVENFVKVGRREVGEIVRRLSHKKNTFSPASPPVATAPIAPKICQAQPPTTFLQHSRFHPNRFTFGGVIAERVNTTKSCQKVNAIFGSKHSFEPKASSRIKTTLWKKTTKYNLQENPWWHLTKSRPLHVHKIASALRTSMQFHPWLNTYYINVCGSTTTRAATMPSLHCACQTMHLDVFDQRCFSHKLYMSHTPPIQWRYLTCNQKWLSSQPSLPHIIN